MSLNFHRDHQNCDIHHERPQPRPPSRSTARQADCKPRRTQPIVSFWPSRPGGDFRVARSAESSAAIRASFAVGLAVSAYGVSFGALAVASGLTIWQTCVLSLVMFSGGSQFAVIGILAGGGSAAGGAAIASAALLGRGKRLYGRRRRRVRVAACHGARRKNGRKRRGGRAGQNRRFRRRLRNGVKSVIRLFCLFSEGAPHRLQAVVKSGRDAGERNIIRGRGRQSAGGRRVGWKKGVIIKRNDQYVHTTSGGRGRGSQS